MDPLDAYFPDASRVLDREILTTENIRFPTPSLPQPTASLPTDNPSVKSCRRHDFSFMRVPSPFVTTPVDSVPGIFPGAAARLRPPQTRSQGMRSQGGFGGTVGPAQSENFWV
jgi:hypothetical protein